MPTLIVADPIKQGQSATLQFDLVNETGTGIDKSELTSLTLSYYDEATDTILNGRDAQNVLDTNDVQVQTTPGPPMKTVVRWLVRPADTRIVTALAPYETHVAIFTWTWGSAPPFSAAYRIAFFVENLANLYATTPVV